MKERWMVSAKKADFEAIGRKFGIDPVTARLIRNRNVIGDEAVEEYLNGGLERLHDPFLLKGCREAVAIIQKKIKEKKRIRIIGDYDIDGVNATYILYQGLSLLDANVDYDIPDRIQDGFGLNQRLVDQALEDGIDTIITCDNGIAAVEEIRKAKECGMTVIVTDHHEPMYEEPGSAEDESRPDGGNENAIGWEDDFARRYGNDPDTFSDDDAEPDRKRIWNLPPADAIVNPRQPGCPYPYKKLCGAAVAWKVIQALYSKGCQGCAGVDTGTAGVQPGVRPARAGLEQSTEGNTPENKARNEKEGSVTAFEFLEFAAFATVGDVMDLDGENRIIVKEGLKKLPHTDNVGLQALMEVNSLIGKPISAYHIGFVLGPCINASGRLETAKHSLALLLSETREEAMRHAMQLKELNDSRKQMTDEQVEAACLQIESSDWKEDPVLVPFLPYCHESIAGIIAGRLRERYYRPVFVVTRAEESAKGSGRSIEGYSMFEEMMRCADVFLKFGGHPMAAGFSLEESRIDEMRRRLNDNCTLTPQQLTPQVHIDVPMPIGYVSERRIRELSLLEPFGKGNEKPLFAQKDIRILSARIIGKNQNYLKLQICDTAGCRIEAMFFGDLPAFRKDMETAYGRQAWDSILAGRPNPVRMMIGYYPGVNEYMGRRTLQVTISHYMFQ